jgi:YYY domain-containing protein
MRDALTWYVLVQAAALAVWPAVAVALAPLSDRGWAAAKAVGVLGLAWLVWFVCMLAPVPFTRGTLAVALIVVAVAAWSWLWRSGGLPAMRDWLLVHRNLLLTWEAVFAAAFALFALLRAHEPAVQFFEKPMDMAFVNGFMSAQRLPTQDTWLSGYGVPYYYFGYFIAACLGKLSGVEPGVAYNLAAATVPALASVALASLAWTLARAAQASQAWAAAGAAVATALALFCGNLRALFEFAVSRGWLATDAGATLGIKNFGDGILPGVWPPLNGIWWFGSSRVVPNIQPDGITEFPFFTAYLSDLHPHFVALPFEVLVLSLAAAHVLSRGATLRSPWTQGLAALALGSLLVINTWDIAPFWLLYVGLTLYATRFCDWRWRSRLATAITPLAGALLFAPYFIGYGGPPLGVGLVTERTPLGTELVLFGWAVVLMAALGLFTRWCLGDRRGWTIVAIGGVAAVALLILGQPTLAVLVAVLGMLLPWPGVIDRFEPAAAMVVGIGAFALAMLLGVELIFLDDVFHSRMNTVFKFDENAWLLAGLAAGVGLAVIGRFTLRVRWLVAGLAGLFILGGIVYPISAIATRFAETPSGGLTLDGLSFLGPDARAAVRWLADQNSGPTGRVVVAEAVAGEYDALSAGLATYSGAATVLGWAGHELQWRGPMAVIGARQTDLAALYRDAAPDQLRTIVDRYGIQYVVVGDEERRAYGDDVTSRFEGVLPVAFRSGSIVIYRAR